MSVDALTFTLVTVLVGGGTLGIRAVFIMLARKQAFPPKLLAVLSFVPAAVFAGLVAHSLHLERLRIPDDPALVNLIALSLAAIVAVKTRSILWTLVSGMGAMWLINWLVGSVG